MAFAAELKSLTEELIEAISPRLKVGGPEELS